MAVVVRVVTLPFVIAFDFASWPITSRTLGRGPWWVVELRFHGPDAEFVRVAKADSREEAQVRLERILATHVPGPGDR